VSVQSPRSLGVGVLLLSLGLMLFELSLTRVLSVLYYYHTAFLAISIAMLGIGAGGLWVHLFPRIFAGRKRIILAVTVLSMGLLPPLFPVIHLELSQLDQFLGGRFILAFGITVLVALLPFLGGGAVLTMTLQENHARVARLYAADLLGAAGGTLLLVPAMDLLGGPGALLSCGVIVAVASLFLAGRSYLTVSAMVAVLSLTAAEVLTGAFPLHVDVTQGDGNDRAAILYEKWNAFSRVVALHNRGWDRGLSDHRVESIGDTMAPQIEAQIDINAYAPLVGFDGDLDKVAYLAWGVENLAHHLLPEGRDVAIIGPGGGKDVLGALLFSPRKVLGIELNPILVNGLVRDRFRDFAGDLYRDPRVEIVVGDGRAELQRRTGTFDLILANSVATFAAHSAGAMNLTEQGLFTDTAFRTYYDRLSTDGILSVSLWDAPGHVLPLRLVSTWRVASGDSGLAERVAIVVNQRGDGWWFTTVLMTKRPFTIEQRQTLRRLVLDFHHDIRPATDDRPFFFYTLRPLDSLRFWSPESHTENIAYFSLVVSLGLLIVLVFLTIGVPMIWTNRRQPAWTDLTGREAVYFAALGSGFMLVEIALMQRLALWLGHPTLALTVVLFGILFWGSLGSRIAHAWIQRPDVARRLRAVLALLVTILIVGGGVLTWFLRPEVSVSQTARIAMALVGLGLPGLLMGMPMPIGLAFVGNRPGIAIPWAWGINGAASVIASVGAIFLAVLFGFTLALTAGVACYIVALVLRPRPESTNRR